MRSNRNRYKSLAAAAVLAAFALLFSACGEEKDVTSVDVSKLAGDLVAQVPFVDEMSAPEEDVFYALYHLDPQLVASYAVYTSTGATAEEVAVIEAAAEKDVQAIKTAVLERVEVQKQEFENYVPEELKKLSDPVIESEGRYVVLCVSDDDDKAEEVIGRYLD